MLQSLVQSMYSVMTKFCTRCRVESPEPCQNYGKFFFLTGFVKYTVRADVLT